MTDEINQVNSHAQQGASMKSYSQMDIQEKIAYDCGGTKLIDDVNTPMRRHFRCWLDGSYNGRKHYLRNCEYLWENRNNQRRLRVFIIQEFSQYIAREYDCSVGHAQKAMVACIAPTRLERLNGLLIDDALDLIADRIQEEEE
tara:strand:+ start:7154 stop:7582 length:429 start_codon:yes stop_codon:yes gene_type:complete